MREPVRDGGGSVYARSFHRPPPSIDDDIASPSRPEPLPAPRDAEQPPWNAVITSIVSGVAIAAFTGHWYFALFSGVTGVVTGASWMARVLRTRRRRRAWAAETRRAEEVFAEECHRYVRELARRRRRDHPSIGSIEAEIAVGGEWLWRARRLENVSIGAGLRAIDVTPHGPQVASKEIPVLIDVSPGSVVGIHGEHARGALSALLVRMAAQVGPSDWRLALMGDWTGMRELVGALPHFAADDAVRQLSSKASVRHVVVLVEDSSTVVRGSVLVDAVDEERATLIVTARERAALPALCTVTVDADDVETDTIDQISFGRLCRAIGRWSDPDLASERRVMDVDFLDLLPCADLSCDAISGHWLERSGLGPLIDIGADEDGTVEVDLDRDGPHGVIIGTTGSGKSELLRHIVVSMALNGSPEDVSFVLIDYKGGSAFDACARLPHVVGVVTDLDQGMIDRVLCGLEAESKRREGILRSARVRDVQEHVRRSKEVSKQGPPTRLARLVVVIDELAAVKDDAPEFVSALASIAQRGRSLGVHLIAATQRSAALGADVLANSSLRIALRVQDSADSREVLGTDRASLIDHAHPGRMFMKVGVDRPREVQACVVSDVLPEVVSAIERAGAGFAAPHRPWRDPLEAVLARRSDHGRHAVGVVDDLRRQSQDPWRFALSGNLLIVGGSGRTNAIRSVLRSMEDACESASCTCADVVVVSCRAKTSDGLESFDGFIELRDMERMWRFLAMCEERGSDRNSASPHLARDLILVVDDFDVWRQAAMTDRLSSALMESFERVVATGPPAGVACIVTAAAESAVPPAIRAWARTIWSGTDRVGVFRSQDCSSPDSFTGQLFWEQTPLRSHRPLSPSVAHALRRLPAVVRRAPGGTEFAVDLASHEAISVRPGEPLRFAVFGSPKSGVTTALEAIAASWSALHPDGRVMRDSASGWTDADVREGEGPLLVVVDGVEKRCDASQFMSKVLGDVERAGRLSIVVGATTSFARSNPEHWIQQVRRARSGVLLGRSIEDCDLLGVRSPTMTVHGMTVHAMTSGRGLLVDGGSISGFVQFVVDPQ